MATNTTPLPPTGQKLRQPDPDWDVVVYPDTPFGAKYQHPDHTYTPKVHLCGSGACKAPDCAGFSLPASNPRPYCATGSAGPYCWLCDGWAYDPATNTFS